MIAWLTSALVLLAAPAPDPSEAALEAALRCARRADHACAARESARAVDAADPIIAREARAVHATALALLGPSAGPGITPDAAVVAAFVRLLEVYPAWRPPPDADARVSDGFGAARRERLRARLPRELDPGPPPEEPRPGPEVLGPLLPPPRLYAPAKVVRPSRLSLSLGAGVGVPSSDRVEAGLHAAVDFRWLSSDALALWVQGSVALLPIRDEVVVEPGHGRGLTAFTIAGGIELRLPIAPAFEGLAAIGVGVGGFGYDSPDEGMGLGLTGALGARWLADANLALRVDVSPVVVIPLEAGVGAGGT